MCCDLDEFVGHENLFMVKTEVSKMYDILLSMEEMYNSYQLGSYLVHDKSNCFWILYLDSAMETVNILFLVSGDIFNLRLPFIGSPITWIAN